MLTLWFKADFEDWCLKPGDKTPLDESLESLENGLVSIPEPSFESGTV